ncbi:netrin receptor UNC5C-like [Oculina patagonica]
MESRVLLMCLVIVLSFNAAHGTSLGVVRSPGQLTGKENSTGHVIVKPEFIAEPDDKFALPNTQVDLVCEAKFVSRLKFNCSGGLVPREIYKYEDADNVTLLVAEISQALIVNRDSVVLCICVATGYNGQVIRSRAAAVQKAYLDEDFIISPSADTRVQKNSLVTLRCQPPAGNPSPAVSWWKDGRPVDTDKNRRVLTKSHANFSLVVIKKPKLSDGGYYSCVASNLVGRRESATIKITVYVDGGWSEWSEFEPCTAKCGNGTKMLKRHCSNPAPENGGQLCTGPRVKIEPCQEICPDVEITCPNHTNVYINRSDVAFKNVSWNKPLVHNKKNGTKFFVEVFPQWAKPPVTLPARSAVYVIKYMVTHEFGQTASCSFNITVYNGSYALVISLLLALVFGLVMGGLFLAARFGIHRKKLSQRDTAMKEYEEYEYKGEKDTLDNFASPVFSHSASYLELAGASGKLHAESPIDSEVFEFPGSCKEPVKTMQIEVDITDGQKRDNNHTDYKRTNSSISNKSTVSEISRMMWNMSNIPENADPKMVAWGLVDHNGGKFTIANTGVSLTVPPQAIPEGRTEGIYIAIMNQKKEHPYINAKESLLSPVVKCGPTGLKFQRPVILSMPHCALLEEGAWNLKVQYNESEPSTAADWKQLIDVNKQDGSEPSHVVVEPSMVHLMVDHFTLFALTGESAAKHQAPKVVQALAYATPPEAHGDCVVRVYCVAGTPAAVEDVHNQEIKKYQGETREPPRQLHFKDGGGDLLVELTDLRQGWTSGIAAKRIRFRDIWEGIERMPSCTFVFSMSDTSVSQFRAAFDVRQDCEGGDEGEINVVTSVKQGPRENPRPSLEAMTQSNNNLTCTREPSMNLPKAASSPCLVHADHSTALVNAGSLVIPWQCSQADVPGACGGGPTASPASWKQLSSGYFSVGFESLPTMNSLSLDLRSKLSVILDPPHESDWKILAENIGLSYQEIRWIDCRIAYSPTKIVFDLWETRDSLRYQFSLKKLTEILRKMGRDDAVELIEAQLLTPKETSV